MKKLSYEKVEKVVCARGYKLLSKYYKNNRQKLEILCYKCYNVWLCSFDNFLRNNCVFCSKTPPRTIKDVEDIVLKKKGIILEGQYKNAKSKFKIMCENGHVWFINFNNLKTGHWCPICAQSKRAKSQNNSFIFCHWKTGQEIICIASYEKAVVEYLNKNKIDFDWQIKFDIPNGKKYFVDLYLKGEDKYVEIKGYFRRKDALEKWNWFHENFTNSELWDKKKLKEMRIL